MGDPKRELRIQLFKENITKFYELCKNHLGKSKYQKEYPCLILEIEEGEDDLMGGYYCHELNEITINYQGWDDSKYCYEYYAKLMYHEFIHYHQSPIWMTRYNNKYEYYDHPYEVEAYRREVEVLDLI